MDTITDKKLGLELARHISKKHFERGGRSVYIDEVDFCGAFISILLHERGKVEKFRGYSKRNETDQPNIDVGVGKAMHRALVRLYKKSRQ